jgi:serine O-acetyltransferase
MATRHFMRGLARQHPPFLKAVIADARCASANLGRPLQKASRYETVRAIVRLAIQSDAFIALALYRGKARLQSLGVPILPRVAHRFAMILAQVSIGDPVVVEAGIYLPHGQVVIDGLVTIGAGTAIRPWVTIGLKDGNGQGPTVGRGVRIGTGAKIIGPVKIGDRASIGANAVVLQDVPPRATSVGIPATVRGPDPTAVGR